MRRRMILGVGLLCAGAVWGQKATGVQVKEEVLPYFARLLMNAQGDRFTVAGKERLTVEGVLSDGKGNRAVRLIWELPGRFRLDEEGGKTLVADPVKAKVTAATAAEQAVLETLQMDSVDGFMQAVDGQAAMAVVARGARSVDEKTKPVTVQDLDVYEVAVAVDTAAGKVTRAKQYYFDVATGMLARVRYVAGEGATQVEVSYTGWAKSAGQAVAGQVERRENGVTTFTIAFKSAKLSGAAKDGVFDQP